MKITFQNKYLTIFKSEIYQTLTTFYHDVDAMILVDPNWLPSEIEFIKNYVEEKQNNQQLYLVFTHSDYDHILAWKAFPFAITIGSKAFVENVHKEKQLAAIRKFDDEYYLERNYEIAYPTIQHVIEENGQALMLGNVKANFYLAPGHTACGLWMIIENWGTWQVGDYLSNMEFPFVYDSVENYLSTLNLVDTLMEKYPFRILIPGHGNPTLEKSEVHIRRDRDRNYLLELKEAIKTGGDFDLEKFLGACPFPEGLMKNHQENVAFIEKNIQ